jgi:hypothetical protein
VPCAGGVTRGRVGVLKGCWRRAQRHRLPLTIKNVIKGAVIEEDSPCQPSIWLLSLFAIMLLAFAAHCRADQDQFIVTYVEFLPGTKSAASRS